MSLYIYYVIFELYFHFALDVKLGCLQRGREYNLHNSHQFFIGQMHFDILQQVGLGLIIFVLSSRCYCYIEKNGTCFRNCGYNLAINTFILISINSLDKLIGSTRNTISYSEDHCFITWVNFYTVEKACKEIFIFYIALWHDRTTRHHILRKNIIYCILLWNTFFERAL